MSVLSLFQNEVYSSISGRCSGVSISEHLEIPLDIHEERLLRCASMFSSGSLDTKRGDRQTIKIIFNE